MAEAAIRVERRGGVVRVTLDRPPLNLLEPGLIAALQENLRMYQESFGPAKGPAN